MATLVVRYAKYAFDRALGLAKVENHLAYGL